MSFTGEVSEKARKLHHDAIVFDGCTFFCEGYSANLEKAGTTVLNVTVPMTDDDVGDAVRNIANYYQLFRDNPKLMLIETVDDIYRAKKENRVGFIIGTQNSRPLYHRYLGPMVEIFYRIGMRISQLCYNERNFAADGCGTDANAGLSREGRELIQEMNRVGMILDLSHVGERSSLEAIEISEKPCIFSHANPRKWCNVPRNLSDEQIKTVAAKGGVVGLTPYAPLNWKGGDAIPTMDDFLDNMEYVIDLVGIDHVAVGTDSEISPGAYPRDEILYAMRTLQHTVGNYYLHFADRIFEAFNLNGFSGMQDFPLLTQNLLDRGWDEESIRKILGLNMVRVFKEVWKEQSEGQR